MSSVRAVIVLAAREALVLYFDPLRVVFLLSKRVFEAGDNSLADAAFHRRATFSHTGVKYVLVFSVLASLSVLWLRTPNFSARTPPENAPVQQTSVRNTSGAPETELPAGPHPAKAAPHAPPDAIPDPHEDTLPRHPQIAVVSFGNDPQFAACLEVEIERRFTIYSVKDEQDVPERNLQQPSPSLRRMLRQQGFHVLILLRTEQVDNQSGGIGPLKAARVRMNAYLLPEDRALGNGWSEFVTYTELSACTVAKRTFIEPTANLRAIMDGEWFKLTAR